MLIQQLKETFTSVELKDMENPTEGEALLSIEVAGTEVPVHMTASYAAVGVIGKTIIVDRVHDRIAEEVLDQALF